MFTFIYWVTLNIKQYNAIMNIMITLQALQKDRQVFVMKSLSWSVNLYLDLAYSQITPKPFSS